MSDYLTITSSGGGGHIVAANAIRQHKLNKNPQNRVRQLDVMRSGCSYGETIGALCTNLWDDAQQHADVQKQTYLITLQPVAEAFFFLGTFFTVLNQLLAFEKLPKKVISTQPLHLLAITLAVRLANLIRYKEDRKISHVDLYLTDLPTEKAHHFIGALQRLHAVSQSCFNMIRVHTPKSAFEDSDTFWAYHAHLKPEQIKYRPLPVSEAFRNAKNLPLPRTSVNLSLQTENGKSAVYPVRGKDKVALIMLGTAPEKNAILSYVDEIIKEGKVKANFRENNDSIAYFFVSCGKAEAGKSTNPLYEEVMQKIKQANLHARIKIVPFINQPVPNIFARSDMTITRSGGITSAEIIALKERAADQKRVLIHSPFKGLPQGTDGKPETNKGLIAPHLIDSIPLWENGNAYYLVSDKTVNATVVTPHFIKEELTSFFRTQKLSLDLIRKFETPHYQTLAKSHSIAG